MTYQEALAILEETDEEAFEAIVKQHKEMQEYIKHLKFQLNFL